MFTSNRLITPASMVSIWRNNISKITNVTMERSGGNTTCSRVTHSYPPDFVT